MTYASTTTVTLSKLDVASRQQYLEYDVERPLIVL